MAQSGGVRLAEGPDEVQEAVLAYLRDPSLHAEGRQWIVDHVCGKVDGRAGERFADAVSDMVHAPSIR